MLTFDAPTWPIKPARRWQGQAFPIVTAHLGATASEPAVVSAIMGSGKALFLCELCATVKLAKDAVVVVSTSTAALVEDLTCDLRRRCGHKRSVGIWYGKRKRLGQIIVCCVDSLPTLAAQLAQHKHPVALWIADEAHRTECSTVLETFATLAPAHSLGLTATPFRADKFEAITLFKKLIYRYGVKEAQADGDVLVPWNLVHASHGMGDDLDATCVEMVQPMVGPGLCNAVDIADAEGFAKYLTERGVPAAAVHSRQSAHDQRSTIEKLRTGTLRALVHVNLLSEGSNYPWICWMLLRREVESRVRFAQEMGRGLRRCDDLIWNSINKRECVFLDPHDQFGSFDLSYAEALGEPPEKPEWEGDAPIQPEVAAERIREGDPPVAMAWIESLVRSLCVACDCAGMMGDAKPIKKAERLKPSTLMQQAALRSAIVAMGGIAPAGWQKCLEEIGGRPEIVRFGFAANLLLALTGIRGAKRWPPIDEERRISGVIGDEQRVSGIRSVDAGVGRTPSLQGVGATLFENYSVKLDLPGSAGVCAVAE